MSTSKTGENNPNARLTDDDVELIRQLWDSEGDRRKGPQAKQYWTAKRLAEKFEISLRQVTNIVGYHKR